MANQKKSQYTRRTPVYNDDVSFIDDPSGTPADSKETIQKLVKAGVSQGALANFVDALLTANKMLGSDANGLLIAVSNIISSTANGALALDAVLSTGLSASFGILVVACTTDNVTAVYRVENQTLVAISAHANFSIVKDTGSKYNVYWETDQFKVQNKITGTKTIKVGFFGV